MTAVLVIQLVCAVLFALLSGFAVFRWRQPCGYALAAACALTAIWAGAAAAETWSVAPGLLPVAFLETMRGAAWVLFAAGAYADGLERGAPRRRVRLLAVSIGSLAIVLAACNAFFEELPRFVSGRVGFSVLIYGHLAVVTGGAVFIEALVSRCSPEVRWRLKYLWLGIATILMYDFVRLTEALIYGRFSPELGDAQATVLSFAAPLVGFAIWRHRRWYVEFTAARGAVVQSVVLVSAGVVLVSISGATAVLSATRGAEGQMIRVTLLAAFLLAAAVLMLSGSSRSFVRKWLRRVFLAPRYDYRAEWQRFVHNLSSPARGATLQERALRAVADVVDSPQSALWLREGDTLEQVMRIGLPVVRESFEPDHPLFREIETTKWSVLRLDDSKGHRSNARPVPESLIRLRGAWLLVPLLHHEQLIGFLVLGKPRIPRKIMPEDEELLEIVSKQIASYLAEERATRALEEANRFREISRSLSFLAHDLRNLTNDLTLSLANARRHIENPDFHPDLLASMDDTVAGMQRLLTQIKAPREKGGETTTQLVDIAELVEHFRVARPLEGPVLSIEIATGGPCLVSGGRDQLQAIMGHLIRNALDAVDPTGRVEVRLSTDGKSGQLEVRDDGPGMSEAFVHDRLHHPFQTTKSTGFGLGLYECREVARSLGGNLVIRSEIGRGTMACLSLPIAGSQVDRSEGAANAS